MAPAPATLSLVQVIRDALVTLRAVRPVLLAAWLCSALPPWLWAVAGPDGAGDDPRRDQMIELVFALTGGLVATGAVYQAARAVQLGAPIGIGTALRRGLRCWGTLLATMFVAELQVVVVGLLGVAPAAGLIYWLSGGGPWMGLALVFGIPGLMRMVSLAVVVPQALFGDAYAFPESTRLCRDHRKKLLVPTLLYVALSLLSLLIDDGVAEAQGLLGLQTEWAAPLLGFGVQSALELGFDLFTFALWVALCGLHPPVPQSPALPQ